MNSKKKEKDQIIEKKEKTQFKFGGSLKFILVSSPYALYSRHTFNLWLLTLKVAPIFGFLISIAPCEKIMWTIKGPHHREHNLPRNRCKRELNKSTFWPGVKHFSHNLLVMKDFYSLLVNLGIFVWIIANFFKFCQLDFSFWTSLLYVKVEFLDGPVCTMLEFHR